MPLDPSTAPDLDTLFEEAPCGLMLTAADGTIARVNATFCRWVGRSASELVGKRRFQDLLTMGGRVFHQTHWYPLLQMQGTVAEVKLDILHSQGHTVPMLLNASRRLHAGQVYQQIAFVVVADRHKYERELLLARKNAETALAAQREAQQALQRSQDLLSLAMRGARMAIWSRNLETGEFWWSRELRVLLGKPASEAHEDEHDDLDFFARVHEADRPALLEALEQAERSGADYLAEFRLQMPDGVWRWMEGRGRALRGAGLPPMLFGLVIDIHERKDAQTVMLRQAEQLRQLNQQLSEADRRKDAFLATLAHELRNPLAPMRNVLALLELKGAPDDELRWAREVLGRQLGHLSRLVDDLLEVSRISKGKLTLLRQRVDLADMVRGAMEAARPAIEAGAHHVTVSLPDHPVFLDADPTRLTQVLLNLLNNAAKYTPRGGHIAVTARVEQNQAVIAVRDSGIGIARESLDTVFEMFSQLPSALDRAQGGLGIGLSLVRGLVELHGGTVCAHSDGPGCGSEFVVRLPLSEAAEDIGAAPAIDTAPHACEVLVVDDNIDAATSLGMILELKGHTVRVAHDGETALRMARDYRHAVALVDIGLPDMTGYELARQLRQREQGASLFLVAVTGWGQEADKAEAMAAGFDRHLTKPVDPAQLFMVLAERC